LFTLLVVVAFYAAVEVILALAGVEPIARREDPYVGFSAQAPLFLAQQQDGGVTMVTAPNKRRWFNRQQFSRLKANRTYRIFCLGGSTTYGRPYEDPTSFCGWLRELLPAAEPAKRWEVINAGGISYASYRIVKVAEELASYEPDLFVVYTGHNEFLEERTYRTIKRLPPLLRNVGAVLSQTRLYAVADRLIRGPSPKPASPRAGELEKEVATKLDNGVGPDAYERDERLQKNILEDFRMNLQRIVRIARDSGAEVMLITPASNLADCAPFKSQHRDALSEADRRRWEDAMQRARHAMADGQFESSLRTIDLAAHIDPRPANLHFLRGRVLLKLQRYAEAKQAFLRARDEDICPLRALTPIVQTVREVAATEKVPLVDFQQQVARRSDHAIPGKAIFLDHVHPTIEGHRMLALAIMKRMNTLGILAPDASWGREAIERVVQRVESRVDRQAQGMALRNLAKVLTWAGKHEEADRLALRAARLVANDAETRVLAGNALLAKGDLAAAIKQFRQALNIDPNYIPALNSLGAAFHRLGRLDEAIRQYQKIIALKPDFAPVQNNLGAIYQRKSKFDLAGEHYAEAIRLNPRYAAAYNNLSVVRRKQGQLDAAELCCLKAIDINPAYAEAYYNLGLVRSAQQRSDDAVRAFRDAIRVAADYGPAYYGLGLERERQGNMAAAAQQYDQAMHHRGTPLAAVRHLAWIRATAQDGSLRDGRRALRLAQKCARATRFSHADTLSVLAAAYAESGQFDQAVRWQSEAVRLAPSNARTVQQNRLDRLRQGRPLRGASGVANAAPIAPTDGGGS